MKNQIFKLFLFAIIIFALGACNDTYKAATGLTSQGSLTCPKNVKVTSQAVTTFEFPAHKVARSEFLLNSTQDGLILPQNADEFKVKKGQQVVVTVNRICMMERLDSSGFALTEKIKLKIKNHKHSVSESYSYTLPRDMKFDFLEELASLDDCVEMISPNVTAYTTALPNDPRFSSQTHLPAIQYNTTHDFLFTGAHSIKSDTVVAIIDNGVDIRHQDLAGLIWENAAEKNGQPGVDDDSNGYVDDVNGYDFASDVADPNHKYTGSNAGYSHGSHVSGLAAAHTNNGVGISGVMARNTKIMALNVFGNSQGAASANIDTAIRYAADMGAKIINMSLGGRGATPSTESAIRYAVGKGVTVVVAAGNDSATLTASTFYTPASYGAAIDGMITIGATDSNPASVGALCSFSNRSSTYVELGAPGCDTSQSSMGVLSLLRNNSYGLMAGTSMASPVAAGVATIVYSFVRDVYNQILTPADVERILKEGSKNFSNLNSTIKNGKNANLEVLKEKLEQEFGPANPPEDPDGTPVCP